MSTCLAPVSALICCVLDRGPVLDLFYQTVAPFSLTAAASCGHLMSISSMAGKSGSLVLLLATYLLLSQLRSVLFGVDHRLAKFGHRRRNISFDGSRDMDVSHSKVSWPSLGSCHDSSDRGLVISSKPGDIYNASELALLAREASANLYGTTVTVDPNIIDWQVCETRLHLSVVSDVFLRV